MSKILSVDNMLEAATEAEMPGAEDYVAKFEKLATELAEALAKHHGIRMSHPASFEPGFGGLCANFSAAHEGQVCPPSIDDKDEGGDFDFIPTKGGA
jgi:hypothetical protein